MRVISIKCIVKPVDPFKILFQTYLFSGEAFLNFCPHIRYPLISLTYTHLFLFLGGFMIMINHRINPPATSDRIVFPYLDQKCFDEVILDFIALLDVGDEQIFMRLYYAPNK